MHINKYLKKPDAYIKYVLHGGRRPTREVHVGNIPLGGSNPIRIQSMTTADTLDTAAVVDETIRLVDAGCDYVRITTPNLTTARNLHNIKNELKRRGYDVPLIADVHFTPNVAEEAARIVEKVRINPGNFVDKKSLKPNKSYTDSDFEAAQERIRQRLRPLLNICKEYGTALRIGTNHGSLSDRILYRYGDTPVGMVESVMEYLRVCLEEGFYNVVISLKASNPLVMIAANRLMVMKMDEEGMDIPLHLGVTEAGEGENARIKSALGIGTLLADGLGDTIRVSLAEPPEAEVPVAQSIAAHFANQYRNIRPELTTPSCLNYNPFLETLATKRPVVIARVDHNYTPPPEGPMPDMVWFDSIPNAIPSGLQSVVPITAWNHSSNLAPWFTSSDQWQAFAKTHPQYPYYVRFPSLEAALNTQLPGQGWKVVPPQSYRTMRRLLCQQEASERILWAPTTTNDTDELIHLAIHVGGILAEGWGEGLVWDIGKSPLQRAFQLLQATRRRMFQTEFIACPSCGRTLFDLQSTTKHIRAALSDYPGLKIAIMGCIVNGFGEMADADYGYIGTGPGRIALFRGHEMVRRNIPEDQAVEALRELIESDLRK